MIFVVIPVFNRIKFTKECLASLHMQCDGDFEIIVVDHGSTDGTSEMIVKEFPKVILLKGDQSMWWTAATNLGVRYALSNKASYVLTLNNDLIVERDYIKNIREAASANPNALIGSISLDIHDRESVAYAGTIWNRMLAKYSSPIGYGVSYTLLKAKYDKINTDLLPGRGTLIPSKAFTVVGLFDELRFPHYMADEDMAFRARKAGFDLMLKTDIVVYSYISATGLNSIHMGKMGFAYLMDTFTSIRSPNKLSVRWNWAKNSRFPFLYFVMDFSRILGSQLLKSLKLR